MNSSNAARISPVEIIVLLVVMLLLGSVLVPSCGHRHPRERRAIDANNLRQIGQAALIYALDNRGPLPELDLNQNGYRQVPGSTPNIHAIAAALARSGGLNESAIWISHHDQLAPPRHYHSSILTDDRKEIRADFLGIPLSFQFIAGLTSDMPAATPIAVTRGLQTDGRWADDRQVSVYGEEGGHIVFLGGNVEFQRNLNHRDSRLRRFASEESTANLLEAIPPDARVFSHPATGTAALDGMPGERP